MELNATSIRQCIGILTYKACIQVIKSKAKAAFLPWWSGATAIAESGKLTSTTGRQTCVPMRIHRRRSVTESDPTARGPLMRVHWRWSNDLGPLTRAHWRQPSSAGRPLMSAELGNVSTLLSMCRQKYWVDGHTILPRAFKTAGIDLLLCHIDIMADALKTLLRLANSCEWVEEVKCFVSVYRASSPCTPIFWFFSRKCNEDDANQYCCWIALHTFFINADKHSNANFQGPTILKKKLADVKKSSVALAWDLFLVTFHTCGLINTADYRLAMCYCRPS